MIDRYLEMVRKRKRSLYVKIDEELYERLWELIKAKYRGSPRGALSLEVQNAIAAWIDAQHTQKHTKPLNPNLPRTHQICSQIVHYLKLKGYTNQVSYGALTSAIATIRGSDARTIKKWVRILLQFGFIKRVGTYIYEIL